MSRSTRRGLDMVLFLLQEQRKAITKVRRSSYKRVGTVFIKLTDDEKKEQVQSVQNQYKRQIGEIYAHLNFERENDGREPLTNPFERSSTQ